MDKVAKNNFGIRLQNLRNKLGLSPTQVAKAVGVSISTYREWENGRSIRGEPYFELAKVLQVSLLELLTGITNENSKILDDFNELESKFKKFKETLYSSF